MISRSSAGAGESSIAAVVLTLEEDVDGGDAAMSTAATVASELLDNAAADVDGVDDALDDAGVEGSFEDLALFFDLRDCLRFNA